MSKLIVTLGILLVASFSLACDDHAEAKVLSTFTCHPLTSIFDSTDIANGPSLKVERTDKGLRLTSSYNTSEAPSVLSQKTEFAGGSRMRPVYKFGSTNYFYYTNFLDEEKTFYLINPVDSTKTVCKETK